MATVNSPKRHEKTTAEAQRLGLADQGRRWLIRGWPTLRVLLQTCAAAALLAQHEGLALSIGGLSTTLEMVHDRYITRKDLDPAATCDPQSNTSSCSAMP